MRVAGLCSGDCTAGAIVYVTIENVRNNYFISSEDYSLTISTLDSSSYVRDSGAIKSSAITPALSPQDISSLTVTRSNKFFTQASDFAFALNFDSAQFLIDSCLVRVTLPKTQL